MRKSVAGDPRIAFFDGLAPQWQAMQQLERQERELEALLRRWEVGAGEQVADVGCGTGTLTRVLLRYMDAGGRVYGVDFSAGMLREARAAIADERVSWLQHDAAEIPLEAGALDRIICYSAWPHFGDGAQVLDEWRRLLKEGGCFHIVHLIARAEVNAIHASISVPELQQDLLLPAVEVAALSQAHGFEVVEAYESEERYLVTARKP